MRADVFVGREAELADVSALLEKVRHVALTGFAGAGKTCLALRLARTLRPGFPGGVHIVELSDAPADLRSLTEMLADVIGVRGQPDVPVLQALIDELVPRRSLIVFDACDRVVGVTGILIGLLLRSVEGLRVLTTSRQRPGLPGEHLYPVGSLPETDAVRLLTVLTDGRLDGTDPAELCKRLDNLPLAIELAAAAPDPGAVDVHVLASDTRRHSSMHAAHDWSHELCDAQERLLWARMSVFSGTFDLEAAEDVCAGGALASEEVVGGLHELVDKSVLVREEGESGVRYRLLNTVREFGAVRLDHLGEIDEMRRRHRDHFLSLSTQVKLGWQGPGPDRYRGLVLESANIRLAIEYCYSRPEEYRKGLDLAGNLWFLWTCCGMQSLGDDLLQRGLDLDDTPGPERVKALLVHGWVVTQRGDLERAQRILTGCAGAAENSSDYVTAYASQLQAHMAVIRGDVGEALRLIKDARERHRSIGNLFPGFLTTYVVVATAMMLVGNHDQAVSVLHEGRDLCDSCGDYWTLIRLDLLRGQAEHLLGNTSAAAAATRDSLRGARLFGDTVSLVTGLEVFVVITESDADDALAVTLLGASRAAWKRTEGPASRSPMLTDLLHASELRLRGRMDRTEFERLTKLGSATSLKAAVEHALQGILS